MGRSRKRSRSSSSSSGSSSSGSSSSGSDSDSSSSDSGSDRGRRRNRRRSREHAGGDDTKRNEHVNGGGEGGNGLRKRKTGGYIPPARLRMMQEAVEDKSSAAYQKLSWQALKKSLNGIVNKVNGPNIKALIPELFSHNLIRGRGLLVQSLMRLQKASLPYTNVYAALVAVVNTKFPQIGELLLKRLLMSFKRGFRRSDKAQCIASTKFLAHLVNQNVAHEIIALQIIAVLLKTPTDDSVEIAVAYVKECGQLLNEHVPAAFNATFDTMRSILHDGALEKRVQYMVEVLFLLRKDNFKDFPTVTESLDLVEAEEQIPHYLSLDEDHELEEGHNVFKKDDAFFENEEKYKALKAQILGDDSEEEGDDEESDEESDNEDDGDDAQAKKEADNKMEIQDETNTNLLNLRRKIYQVIKSSLGPDETVHKLLKMNVNDEERMEVVAMVIDCCNEERSYLKFFGIIGRRFSIIHRSWQLLFEEQFETQYLTIHRLNTNKIRNCARFFGHLLFTDSISWTVLKSIRLNEDDTTSSSRIFIKILITDISEAWGVKKLSERFKDPQLQDSFLGILPRDNPRDTRFAIYYFHELNLDILTEDLRTHMKLTAQRIMQQQAQSDSDSGSDSDSESDSSSSGSDSSSGSSSSSGSDSESEAESEKGRGDKGRPSKSTKTHEGTDREGRRRSPYRDDSRRRSPDDRRRRSPDDRRRRSPDDKRRRSPDDRRRRSPDDKRRRSPDDRTRGRRYRSRSRSPRGRRYRSRSRSPRRRSPDDDEDGRRDHKRPREDGSRK